MLFLVSNVLPFETTDLPPEDEEEIDMEGEDMEIQPNSQPPEVPAEGTYVDALNEAGVEQERIEHH